VNAARTAGVCLGLAGLALAGPSFRIGTKLTWGSDAGSSGLAHDRFGEPVVMVNYDSEFVGAAVEAVYGPLWNILSGRIDIYQIRIHTDDALIEFFLLPMLGLDVMAELPVDWRLKPYVWAGARAPAYIESFASSPFELPHGWGTHWVGGLGARFRLTKRVDLFAEAQLYSNDLWRDDVGILREGSFTTGLSGTEVSGLVSAEIGARFALGK
jgi:hypothetical protein